MLEEGALRPGAGARRGAAHRGAGRSPADAVRACATPTARPSGSGRHRPRRRGGARRPPLRDLVTASPTTRCWSSASSPCSAPGTRSSRAARAPLDPRPGGGPRGTLRTAAERLPAIAAMGFDIVYLTPVHPIGPTATARARTTPSTRRPTTPAARRRSARAEGGHDAIHPDLGTFDDFDDFVRGRAARPRGRPGPRPAVLPRPPWVEDPPRVVHDSRRRHRSPTPRTRRRSTRTSTR